MYMYTQGIYFNQGTISMYVVCTCICKVPAREKKKLICVRISTVFHVEMKTYLYFLSHVCLHTHYTLYTHTCRNKSYDSELRYSRTLSVLHQLYVLCRGGKLPEESVMKVFPLVIPDWLDLLVKLRSEPGKMERLQDKFKYVG